jgi:hypothetical protein
MIRPSAIENDSCGWSWGWSFSVKAYKTDASSFSTIICQISKLKQRSVWIQQQHHQITFIFGSVNLPQP